MRKEERLLSGRSFCVLVDRSVRMFYYEPILHKGVFRMTVGCVKELKLHEYRVGITPGNAQAYARAGHTVLIERGVGEGSSYEDAEYASAGARIADTAEEVWAKSDLLVKVKEPLAAEIPHVRKGQIVYTYFHLAADEHLADAMMKSGAHCVAYETIEDKKGGLPCLKPMSEIAGRLSIQEGAKYLEKPFGGRGILLGGVPGVPRGKIAILGAGVVGTGALKAAVGIGAEITILDINLDRLAYLDDIYSGRITTLLSSPDNIVSALSEADLVIGAVLIPGGAAPKLIKREYLPKMKKGAVIVDVAIDQGGCCETSRMTYHDAPVFEVDGVLHYCVGNMPGATPRTSTIALTNATFAYGLKIANFGLAKAVGSDPGLMKGVNISSGICTNENLGLALGLPVKSPAELFA